MELREIALKDLLVNERNDRHDDVGNENEAVEWLLNQFGKRMENLGKDIVESRKVFEPPLVVRENDHFRVYDGNRRVTALKLLKRMVIAPREYEAFWDKLASQVEPSEFETILCHVETEQDAVDEILYRRHNGSNDGVGQNDWDDEARQNFLRRTGKQKRIKISDAIVEMLRDRDRLPHGYRILRSKVDRLLSAKKFQRPLGFEFNGESLEFILDEEVAINRILDVVTRLSLKQVTLADIWDEKRKTDFIEACGYSDPAPENQPYLQFGGGLSEAPAPRPVQTNAEKLKLTRTKAPRARDTVIPNASRLKVEWSSQESRARQIWLELEYQLSLSKQPNSCAVMTRVLLDIISTDYFETCIPDKDRKKFTFKQALVTVARHLMSEGLLSEKLGKPIVLTIQRDDYLSAEALNTWVHDPAIFPSPDHLRQLWNSVEPFVIAAADKVEKHR